MCLYGGALPHPSRQRRGIHVQIIGYDNRLYCQLIYPAPCFYQLMNTTLLIMAPIHL